MEPQTLSLVDAAFAGLAEAAETRAEAIHTTLDLVSLRVAGHRGLLPLTLRESLERGLFDEVALCQALEQLPYREAPVNPRLPLRPAARFIARIPDAALTPRLPGEIYERLLEAPIKGADQGARKALRRQRRSAGAFFTPPAVIDRILELAFGPAPPAGTVCDPAMGAGHFLLAVIARLAGAGDGRLPEARRFAAERLYGVDCDAAAVRLAQRALWLTLSRPGDAFAPPTSHFVYGDALLDEAPFPDVTRAGGFHAIIGNPPYDVLTNFRRNPAAKRYAAQLRASGRYVHALCGQVNLYRCFIERSLQLLRAGGSLSFVVPASLLTDKVAAPLRRALLLEHGADCFDVHDESAGVFAHVTQAVTLFRARKGTGEAPAIHLDDQTVSLRQIEGLSADLPLPRATATDWALADWLREHAPRSFAALATGCVGEVDQTLYRRHMRDTPPGALLLRGCHLRPFAPDLRPAPGRQRFLDAEGFLTQKGNAAERCQARVGRERVAQLGIRNLETRPRLVAARVPPDVFLGNSLNVWLPREPVSTALLTGLLNSALYDWRFRLTSGNNNINLREVESLPLPARLKAAHRTAIEEQVEACARAARAGADLSPARRRLDEAVCDAFGLPDRFRRYLLGSAREPVTKVTPQPADPPAPSPLSRQRGVR